MVVSGRGRKVSPGVTAVSEDGLKGRCLSRVAPGSGSPQLLLLVLLAPPPLFLPRASSWLCLYTLNLGMLPRVRLIIHCRCRRRRLRPRPPPAPFSLPLPLPLALHLDKASRTPFSRPAVCKRRHMIVLWPTCRTFTTHFKRSRAWAHATPRSREG